MVPDLVEIGIDSLNPLEVKAGMDPVYLKKTFGDKLAFHGGINAQIMDQPDLVRAEMERLIPLLKEGGGYIFATSNVPFRGMPWQRYQMILDIWREKRKY